MNTPNEITRSETPAPLATVRNAQQAVIRERHHIESDYEVLSVIDHRQPAERRGRAPDLVIVVILAALGLTLVNGTIGPWIEHYGLSALVLAALGLAVWYVRGAQ